MVIHNAGFQTHATSVIDWMRVQQQWTIIHMSTISHKLKINNRFCFVSVFFSKSIFCRLEQVKTTPSSSTSFSHSFIPLICEYIQLLKRIRLSRMKIIDFESNNAIGTRLVIFWVCFCFFVSRRPQVRIYHIYVTAKFTKNTKK